MMNHQQAIESKAAAAYLLGDLSDVERDAFEEHYFDCVVCGDTVRAGAAMFAAGQEVSKSVKLERGVLRFRERFQRPMTWAAAASLAVVVGYQGVIIPRIQTLAATPVIEVIALTPFVPASTRGSNDVQEIHFEGKSLVLSRDIPPEQSFPRYEFEIRTASGEVLGAAKVAEKQAGGSDPIYLSVRPLPVGRYVLAIMGVRKDGNRSEVDRWSIVVQ